MRLKRAFVAQHPCSAGASLQNLQSLIDARTKASGAGSGICLDSLSQGNTKLPSPGFKDGLVMHVSPICSVHRGFPSQVRPPAKHSHRLPPVAPPLLGVHRCCEPGAAFATRAEPCRHQDEPEVRLGLNFMSYLKL